MGGRRSGTGCLGRGILSLLASWSILACTAAGDEGSAPAGQQSSLRYGTYETSTTFPTGDDDVVTIGFQVFNVGDEHAEVHSIEIDELEGIEATAELMVGTPRRLGLLGSAVGPPEDHSAEWEPEAEHAPGPVDLPPEERGAAFGHMTLYRVERVAEYGFIKGFWVTGTEGGRRFRDYVATFHAFCFGAERLTAACDEYAAEHDFEGRR